MADYELEREVAQRLGKFGVACGIDEVGVGALAGPLVAAAVVIDPRQPWTAELDDSKRLSPAKREELYVQIQRQALCVEIEAVSATEIDSKGIAWARLTAMELAFIHVADRLPPGSKLGAVVDGRFLAKHRKRFGGEPSIFLDKADQRSLSVAAASIIAKVWRDTLIASLDDAFTGFTFSEHKGYPTPKHLAELAKYGPTVLHRRSFKPVSRGYNPTEE